MKSVGRYCRFSNDAFRASELGLVVSTSGAGRDGCYCHDGVDGECRLSGWVSWACRS